MTDQTVSAVLQQTVGEDDTAIAVGSGSLPVLGTPRLLAWCEDQYGLTLGIGIADLSGKAFRIAHMGHVNAPMMLGTLGVIESGLLALDIPHGAGGISAAAAYLGSALGA